MGQNQSGFYIYISLTNTLDRRVYCVLSAILLPSKLHTFFLICTVINGILQVRKPEEMAAVWFAEVKYPLTIANSY